MTTPSPRVVVSLHTPSPSDDVLRYILECLAHPDEGSEFARMVTQTRLMERPEAERVALLLQAGYVALVYPGEETPLGHAFLQRQQDGSELHLFSLGVTKRFRGQDFGWAIVCDLLGFARDDARITRVRLSKGEHGYFGGYVLPRIETDRTQLERERGLRVSPDLSTGFVTIHR